MESELVLWLSQAQQTTDAAAQAQAVAELVAGLMRSQKLGRPPQDDLDPAVYREFRDRLQAQVRLAVQAAMGRYRRDRDDFPEWRAAVLTEAYRNALTDDQLKQLALEAQRHPARSPQRQHALTQLVEAIRRSGRLARPHRGKFSPPFYDLLYEEALNQTLTYICRKIDTYDPARGTAQKFMNWVNFRLDRQIIECRRDFNEQEAQELPSLNDLEAIAAPPPAAPSLANEVQAYIAADPEGMFQAAHIRGRPDASFQAIALARFAEQSWEAIATDFDLKVPTLSSFFQRCCDKFAPHFQRWR